jgi:hypothetical protein
MRTGELVWCQCPRVRDGPDAAPSVVHPLCAMWSLRPTAITKTYLELNTDLGRLQGWVSYRRAVVRSGAYTHVVDVRVEEELGRVSDDDWD